MNAGKDLRKEPPVSPRERIAGFALLPRTIDKCRATLWGNAGEYHFDCPFDNVLFSWKGIKAADLKLFIAEGNTNDDIAKWVKDTGIPKTADEITRWSDNLMQYKFLENPKTQAWLQGENVRLGLKKDAPLVDMLEADDKASFKKK